MAHLVDQKNMSAKCNKKPKTQGNLNNKRYWFIFCGLISHYHFFSFKFLFQLHLFSHHIPGPNQWPRASERCDFFCCCCHLINKRQQFKKQHKWTIIIISIITFIIITMFLQPYLLEFPFIINCKVLLVELLIV